jgi:hypothetical protein
MTLTRFLHIIKKEECSFLSFFPSSFQAIHTERKWEKFIMKDDDDDTILIIFYQRVIWSSSKYWLCMLTFCLLHLPMSDHFVGLIFFLQLNISSQKLTINSTKWPLVNSSLIMNSFNCIRPNNCSFLYYFTYLVNMKVELNALGQYILFI